METKKNPDKDLHRQSSKFFLIGLSISMMMAISAFEWATKKKTVITDSFDPILEEVTYVLPTTHDYPMSSPPEIEPIKKVTISLSVIKLTEVTDKSSDQTDIPTNDVFNIPTELEISTLPPEDSIQIFVSPEVGPKPVGGYEEFYREISKSLKYPHRAMRQEVQGQVYVEFVIDRKGEPSQLRIIKGIGAGCDEEALRVIAKSRWEPGRQRGKPVKVRMVIPINFRLE